MVIGTHALFCVTAVSMVSDGPEETSLFRGLRRDETAEPLSPHDDNNNVSGEEENGTGAATGTIIIVVIIPFFLPNNILRSREWGLTTTIYIYIYIYIYIACSRSTPVAQ